MSRYHHLDDATRRHLRRLDLLAHDVTAPFCCGGTVSLASPPGLRFSTGRPLSLEFGMRSRQMIDALKRRCKQASFGEGTQTREDKRVRDGLQLNAAGGAFTLEGFDPAALGILETIRGALCPRDANPLRAELYALNLYLEGGHFASHKDTPRGSDMVGSLVVGLADGYRGGRLIVSHRGATETFAWGGHRAAATGTEYGWAAFFGDVDHEVARVFSGARITLSFTLRRGEGAVLDTAAPHSQTDLLADALRDALKDDTFMPHGGELGFSCFHLYAETTGLRGGAPVLTGENASMLKGRDQHVAAAALRLGLKTRLVPYLVETCAEERWALTAHPGTTQKMMFRRGRLTRSTLESRMPVTVDPDNDGVTWVVVPRLDERRPLKDDAATEFLGEVEYSSTGYFGNEAGPSEFYAHAALLVDIPQPSQRARLLEAVVEPPVPPVRAKVTRAERATKPEAPAVELGAVGELLTAAQLRERGVTDSKRKALLAGGALEVASFGWYRVTGR